LLYALIARVYNLSRTTAFRLEIGEGLEIDGQMADREAAIFDLRVIAVDSLVSEVRLTTPQLLLFLTGMISQLETSIISAEIDMAGCLRKFPPFL
jgi:hypothetical protein